MSFRIRAFKFKPGEPPAEFKLWSAGDNPTDYGVHRWTDRSVAEVSGEYEQRGNPLQIDVEHNGAKPADGPEPPKTGGYARFELRNSEPWLVFDWSAYAVEQIRTRQRLFLSPEYDVDKKTGEIIRLIRVSLVGDPGTHHARMLASKGNTMDPKRVKEALAALMAGDAEKAMAVLAEIVTEAAGGETPAAETPAAAAAEEPPKPPTEAAADTPPASPTDEPKIAAAPEEPKIEAAAGDDEPMTAAALAKRFDAFERDQLLDKFGHRLTDGQRTWASTQSAKVVKGLIAASPEKEKPAARTTATRGDKQGTAVTASRLPAEEKADLDERMGIRAHREPIRRKGTSMVFGVLTRDEAAKRVAAKAAKAAGGAK